MYKYENIFFHIIVQSVLFNDEQGAIKYIKLWYL